VLLRRLWIKARGWPEGHPGSDMNFTRSCGVDKAVCLSGAESQLAGHEYLMPSALVVDKVAVSACSAYDCEYVALAEDMGTVLVTSNKQFLPAFPTLGVSLSVFAETAPGGSLRPAVGITSPKK
jgi:hypothetical protein